MKRLTERTDIGDSPLDEIAFINPDDAEGLYNLRDIAKHGSDELLYEIANRLAEYEDMEEQGLLVRLPCKVGDTVYILAGPNGHKYEKDICEGFYIGDDGVVQVRVRNTKGNHGTYGIMGETVFLTREEAEKALEALGK